MSASPRNFVIYTAEGVTFEAKGATLSRALSKIASEASGHTIIAAIASDCVVTPSPGKLTALIVRHSGGGASL